MLSPLLVAGLVFMVNDQGGVASCLDAKTGDTVWRKRLGNGGSHWASPVHAGGKIFFCSDAGDIAVIAAAREFKRLADNYVDDGFMASPAIAGDALILRSKSHLYCFAEGATGGVGRAAGRAKRKTGNKKDAAVDLAELAARLKQAVKNGEMTEEEAMKKYRQAAGKGKCRRRK